MKVYSYYQSPVGLLRLESDGENLTGLYFAEIADDPGTESDLFSSVKNWLDAYFSGVSNEADFSIHLDGTLFQKQVWEILSSIPFGEVRTYGDIAREMAIRTGKEKMSAQAVGQAVGRNPVSIIVPVIVLLGQEGSSQATQEALIKRYGCFIMSGSDNSVSAGRKSGACVLCI